MRSPPPPSAPHVVILGGGFGGLTAAQSLADAPVHVTLIDRRNHHLFQPLLYQVASAGLSPADIAAPIRAILAGQSNVTVLLGDATNIDVERGHVTLGPAEEGHDASAPIAYDFLIVATGAKNGYFGHDEWTKHAIGLKSLEEALEIRRRVLVSFERAEREDDAAHRAELLTFVVIGGGATGVEMAGALAELARTVLAEDFRKIDPSRARVVLIEAGERILPAFGGSLPEHAAEQLAELGVEVHRGARVTDIDERGVTIVENNATVHIPTATVIWGAGVAATRIGSTLGAPIDRAGRVHVNADCTIAGHDNIFVIGDAAHFTGADGKPLPGVSPVAMQQARHVALIITEATKSRDPAPRPKFQYFDKGSMATIGRSRAIAEVRSLRMTGLLAWLAWLVVHLWYLIGFRNRFVVMFSWAWSYFTYRRGARLITEETRSVAGESKV